MLSCIKITVTSTSNRNLLSMFEESFQRIRTRDPKAVLPTVVTR